MRVIILAVNPDMLHIEIIEKSQIPFPVSFRLCVDGENELIVETDQSFDLFIHYLMILVNTFNS